MVEFKGHFIGGQWTLRTSGSHFSSTDPYRQIPILEASCGRGEEVDDAVAAATRGFHTWRKMSLDVRAEGLLRLRQALLNRKAELADAICSEMGKTLAEATAEAQACVDKVSITLQEGRHLIESFAPEGVPGACHFLPLGVLAVIGPYNFPAHLANGHIVPALLSGNAVVFKPSSVTPLTGQIYAQAMEAADLPPGVFNLLQISRPLGDRLISHTGVRGVLFTGSYGVGRHLKALTADDPWKLLALEMGGKNVAIVADDAHLEQAVTEVIMGAYLTTGQRCTRTARALVHESLMGAFEERLLEAARGIVSADPRRDETFMGPLASAAAHAAFVRSQQAVAGDTSIRTLVPYRTEPGWSVGAALHRVDHYDGRHPYVREEIFGPDLCIESVSSLAEAIARANDTDYGLALAVFSARRDTYETVLREVPCGIVNWNRGTIGATGKLPFGGLGKSGNHRPAALWAPYYCTYPVAELQNPWGQIAELPCPGVSIVCPAVVGVVQ